MPPRRSVADKNKYFRLISQGASSAEACRVVGITPKTARAWEKNMKDETGRSFRERQQIMKMRGPIAHEDLLPEARQALDDFELFRRMYFGRISSPWQVDAANKFIVYLASDRKEYVVLNCPPGAGKSTLLHDIEAWLTCRNRAIRGLLGSRTDRLAALYALRLKRTLERPRPPQVEPAAVAAGLAGEPVAALSQHYGRFQPDLSGEIWQQKSFVVAQIGDIAASEKEPTWQSFGLDTRYLGNRLDISVWDDAITKKDLRTADAIEKLQSDWDDEAESRLEPGGALFLVGQRLGPNDIYRHCLDKPGGVEFDFEDDSDDDDYIEPYEITPEGSNVSRKYHAIKYPAHDENNCTGRHKRKDPYWPEGCLLDPHRLPWRELSGIQNHNGEKYRTVYQQEDVDEDDVLVPRIWITGGETRDAYYPGCYDADRGLAEVPKGLANRVLSIVTVDPSPTQYWSVQWWLFDPITQLRHLMDLERRKMGADAFLDFNPLNSEYSGLIDSWHKRSVHLGKPITELIVERNGAQRFMLKYAWYQQWLQKKGITLRPHDTTTNKADEEFGVQTIGTNFKFGRVRLPNRQDRGDMGFVASRKLVDEVTTYPHGTTNDCVMAYWFLEYWIPRLNVPRPEDMPVRETPHWLAASTNIYRGVA